jgi:hemoglobin/transferrin/lactoferrin receptor protein
MGRITWFCTVMWGLVLVAGAQDTLTGPEPDKPRPEATPGASTSPKDKTKDEPKTGKKNTESQPIVVIGSRVEESPYDIPQSVDVVTPDDISRRLSLTPAELLREEPGVWVQQTGHAGGTPIIRGQIGNKVLYLWDGVRINNGALYGGPNTFLNQIQPGAIDRIEILRGPAAVQYGSDAIGGVINVITKRADEFPKDLSFGGRLHAQYGSADAELTEYMDTWVASPYVNAIVGGTLQHVDDYTCGGGYGTLENTGYRTQGYYGRVGLKLSDTQRLWIGWQDFQRLDVENYTQSKINASGIPRLFTPLEGRSLLQAEYEAKDFGGWISELKAYTYLQDFESRSNRLVETATLFNKTVTEGHQWTWGGGLQGVSLPGAGIEDRLVYGIDIHKDDLNSSPALHSTVKATGITTDSIPQGNTPEGTYDVFDVFALYDVEILKGWKWIAGVRFESSHLDSAPQSRDPVAPFTLDDLDINERWNAFTWSIGSVYWLDAHWNVAADVATGFRAPTYSDTLSFSVPVYATGIASIPSPDVDPEHSINYELGLRHVSECWQGSLTGYWTMLSDTIISKDTGGTVVVPGLGTVEAWKSANGGRGFVRGIEVAASYRLTDAWTLFGNYSEAYGEDTTSNVPLRFIPPRTGLLGIRWEEPQAKEYWVEGLLRIVDRKRRAAPGDKLDAGFSQDPGYGSPSATNPPLREGYQIPGYMVAGLRMGVRLFTMGKVTGDLTLSVENLANKRYRQAFSRQLYEPGTNAITALDIRF